MRFIVQRVREASVAVDEEVIGKIDAGFLVFVGISASDTVDKRRSLEISDKMVKKLVGLRIFRDESGKNNR